MKTKGFTLIELLLVVAIISLLTSVVYASLKDIRAKAATGALIGEIRGLNTEAEIYYVDSNSYSSSGKNETCPSTSDSEWGFFGTQKGVELTTSIKKRLGGGIVTCAVTPTSWAFFGEAYVSFFVQDDARNIAYAQEPILGYICIDSTKKVIYNNFSIQPSSDGSTREALKSTIKITAGVARCEE